MTQRPFLFPIKTREAIAAMRTAGKIAGETLADLEQAVQPGRTPRDIDQLAATLIRERGGHPAFLGYRHYPATTCISVNDALVHGIPTDHPFQSSDVVGIDIGVIIDGWYADTALTVAIPPVDPKARQLLKVTQAALIAGISQLLAGHRLGNVQAAIQAVIEPAGLGLVRELTGHGIGRQLHEPPEIPNYGKRETGLVLRPGMTLCLEPMVTLGTPRIITDTDGWTIRTRDRSLAAQFEHTLLVTDGPPEILTLRPGERVDPSPRKD